MSRVARLRIDDWSVTVSLSVAEKIQALHIRTGTGLPGVILVGTARDGDSMTFAVCHARPPWSLTRPAV